MSGDGVTAVGVESSELATVYAYGFDVVAEIDPAVYEITDDARGRAYAFRMDEETGERLATIARGALERPRDVAAFDVQPGYVRVRVEPDEAGTPTSPKDVKTALRVVRDRYNEQHATEPEFDGVRFGDYYVGTYRPAEAPTAESFLERHAGGDVVPEHDGPVYEREHDLPDYATGAGGGAQLGYRLRVPFDPEMYTKGEVNATYPFQWDEPATERFDTIVERRGSWPGYVERVVAYPDHVAVTLRGLGLGSPVPTAERVRRAVLRYNVVRGEHPDLGGSGRNVLLPRLALKSTVYIEGLAPVDGGPDAWIRERGLDDVEGAPREPAPEETADGDGWLGRVFGRGA